MLLTTDCARFGEFSEFALDFGNMAIISETIQAFLSFSRVYGTPITNPKNTVKQRKTNIASLVSLVRE